MADKCSGHSKRTGEQCNNPPMKGAAVCRMHGGATTQARTKARQRRATAAANAVLARLDVPPVEDPFAALAELAGQAIAFKDILAERVNQLKQIRYRDHKGSEQLRSEMVLWERALDRCERFVTSMAKLDIDNRLVKISEAQAEIVLRAIDAALDAAEVEADRRPQAQRAASGVLRTAA